MTIAQPLATVPVQTEGGGGFKNGLIFALIVLLGLSFVGINLLDTFSNLIKSITDVFSPALAQILSLLGDTAGTTINKTADIAGDTAKVGIDIAEGTVQNIGDLLIKAGKGDPKLNSALKSKKNAKEPDADKAENPIQNPISKGKNSWCLVGEFESRRGCIEVGDTSKCMSGQTFPSRSLCMNPTQGTGIATKSLPPAYTIEDLHH